MTFHDRVSFSTCARLLATATSVINVGGLTLLCGWTMPVGAAAAAPTQAISACAPVTSAQHDVLEAASNGVDALRDHLWARRGIRGYDLVATVQWIDDYRTRSASCGPAAGQVALITADKPTGESPAGDPRQ